MAATKMTEYNGSAEPMMVWNGTSWEFNSNYYGQISLESMMEISDPNYQEAIIHILMRSFTDPRHVELFINELSPTDELKQVRHTIWQLLR